MIESHRYCALIANGAIHNYSLIAALVKEYSYIVAVDGGIIHCHHMNITPHLIIGDLDSAPIEMINLYAHVPIERFPQLKDESDLELALERTYHNEIERITIFGALEKRMDHGLANLFLLERYPLKVFIETENELIFAIQDFLKFSCRPGQIVSIMALGDSAEEVSSKGLQWELKDKMLTSSFYSLSNVCLGNSFEIRLKKGRVLIFLQK